MKEDSKRFLTFENLEVYQAARKFRVRMYAVSRRLPDFEKYDLARQMRTAAVSLTNNIAEGHGRFHYPDQIKFMLQSRGSLEELLDDLNICADENYLSRAEVDTLKEEGFRTLSVLNGYIRHLRQKSSAENLAWHETSPPYPAEPPPPDDDLEL